MHPWCLHWVLTMYWPLCLRLREITHHSREASVKLRLHSLIVYSIQPSCHFMHFSEDYWMVMYRLPGNRMSAGEWEAHSPCYHVAFSLRRWTSTINIFSIKNIANVFHSSGFRYPTLTSSILSDGIHSFSVTFFLWGLSKNVSMAQSSKISLSCYVCLLSIWEMEIQPLLGHFFLALLRYRFQMEIAYI